MMMQEFTERTGFKPSYDEYKEIEKAYYDFNGNKDAFCKDWLKKGGVKKICDARLAKIEEMEKKLADAEQETERVTKKLEDRIHVLYQELEKEQEWKPAESSRNVSNRDYNRLAEDAKTGSGAHYMSDEEAIQWISEEFGFAPEKISIIHEVNEYEVNRHGMTRKTGKMIDRRPVYCATDYYYIRFNVGRFNGWMWEAWNGEIRPYYA